MGFNAFSFLILFSGQSRHFQRDDPLDRVSTPFSFFILFSGQSRHFQRYEPLDIFIHSM
jgi:hypothetical protein